MARNFVGVIVLDSQLIEKLLPDHVPMLGRGPTYSHLFAYMRITPNVQHYFKQIIYQLCKFFPQKLVLLISYMV